MFNPKFLFFIFFALLSLFHTSFGQSQTGNSTSSVPFTFTLPVSARTSAGVFKKDGTLVRTLWGGVNYSSGTHTVKWDGTDDDGRLIEGGNFDIKVLSNNVKYEWEGVIGNTSSNLTGDGVHRSFLAMSDLAITGSYAFYTTHYNELAPSQGKFLLSDPQVKINVSQRLGVGQTTEFVATDGLDVYWGGDKSGNPSFIWASKVSDNSEIAFPNGTSHEGYNSINVVNSRLSGLAVQKSGSFLFASHNLLNQINVLNKTTGAFVRSIAFNSPGVVKVDQDDNLWVISGTNVTKHIVNTDGSISSPVLTISSLQIPTAMAISPDNNTVVIVDGGACQQIKAFNTSNGAASWVYGQYGGYATDPTVTNDKFDFYGSYLAFQADGSFWVGDRGNYRAQHYSANRTFIDRIMYIPCFYSSFVDPNNPTRVFANYLEFSQDYSKPLGPNNGSWALVKNYRYSLAQGESLSNVVTLKNGRTYGFVSLPSRYWKVVELMPNAPLRPTGNTSFGVDSEQFYPDGSVRQIYSFANVPLEWRKTPLVGFDASNNPIWGTKTTLATTPPITIDDPRNSGIGGTLRTGEQTSSDVMVVFNAAVPNTDNEMKYHLGGVRVGDNKWLWKTAKNTYKAYNGPYPSDGSFDIGNRVNQYGGSVAMAMDRSIFWGYHGEFWKNSQANMWNQVYDDGLLVGQFGATGGASAPAGMAGNAFSGSICKTADGSIYLFHNDESYHGGIHRWKITGVNTIQEQTIAVTLPTLTGGLSAEYFDGNDLDNFNVKVSKIDPAVNVAAAPSGVSSSDFSARWIGFVKPSSSGSYTFYTNGNKGVRLWIDDNLVIDKWYNNSQVENSSTPVNLEAQKGYKVRIEMNGGTCSLSWAAASQAKQIIPAANLIPGDIIKGEGYDLLQNLPFSLPLENNLYGWKRDAPVDEQSRWQVSTNISQSDKRKSPDLDLYYAKDDNQYTVYTVTRNLGNSQSLTAWKLSGDINYDGTFPNEANGGQFLEVLDNNGKIISRFFYTISFDPGSPATIYGNDKIIHKDENNWISWETWRNLPINISASNGKVTFKYGYYDAVTTDIFDPTANWQAPKTMRIYFRGWKYNRKINIYDMKFATNGDIVTPVNTTPPIVSANDTTNTLIAFHNLGNPEIFVSENNKGYMNYTGQIDVGDVDRPAGYWKFKIRAAQDRNESSVVESPAFKSSRFIPDAPSLMADDYSNILSASSIYGPSEILVSEDDGNYLPYIGQINVGSVSRRVGYWKFKIKSAPGRCESPIVESPAFNFGSTTTPVPPTILADDYTNYLSVTHSLGISEIVISQNDGPYTTYNGPGFTGDVDIRAGFWKFKIKAAAGRNESVPVLNPAFTVGTTILTPEPPSILANDVFNVLGSSSSLGASEIVVSENGGPYLSYSGQRIVGNVARPFGYWKFKIKSAPGRNESAIVLSPAFTLSNSNMVPDAPILQPDDNANTLSASSALGISEILVSENGAAFVQYIGQISVGNVVRSSGYWKFKIKAATGRDESNVVESPAFTNSSVTPAAPVLQADDNANVLSATSSLGNSEILVCVNSGPYVAYTGQISVGNLVEPVGYWKFKIRSSTGRNESPVTLSPAFTIDNTTPAPPSITADDNTNYMSVTHPLGLSEIVVSQNDGPFTAYAGPGNAGDQNIPTGFWKFKIKSAPGRNESAVVSSPAFTIANSSAAPPVLVADDAANVLSASSIYGTSEILVCTNDGPYVAYTSSIAVGNVAAPAGYWKFKVRSVSGRNESVVIASPAFTITNTTPSAPSLFADDNANTLSASSILGLSEILVSTNNGLYSPYTGQINAGNIDVPAGYWKFKIKAATGRNESAIVQSPAFTITNTTPSAPSLFADDNANTLSASSALGVSEILISVNNGLYIPYTGQISVSNIDAPAGYWKFKIKATTGRNESAIVQSPAFTITNTTPSAPSLFADDNANTLSASSVLGVSEILISINNGLYIPYIGQISVGNIDAPAGYWKFKIKATTGRNESAIVQSPAFTVTNTTPSAPSLFADDNANTLSASSVLGVSEILVSINNSLYTPYIGQISVGNIDAPAGYWKFKIKATTGRNESAIVQSPAFTVTNTTPSAPSLFSDDNANTLSASSVLGVSEILVSINNGLYTPYTGQINVGNIDAPAGYWKFKIKAATGRNESAIVQSPAFTIINTTPSAPSVFADDNANTLSAYSSLGTSEILMSVNNGAYVSYSGQIIVGNINVPAGYWKFKIRAATGRNESAIIQSPAFTALSATPAAPSVFANDSSNIVSASSTLGISEILVSVNNGAYAPYTGQITVGNVDAPVGYWKFKIKAATGRNESLVALSPAFTITNATPSAPSLVADDNTNTLSASSSLGISEILVSINNGTYAPYTGQIIVGNLDVPAGYWKFKIKAATGRNESLVALSPAFTVTNTTPSTPSLAADDSANTLSASSSYGSSEILVSTNNGAYIPYTGSISVGNIDVPAGYWKFKIKAATGRNESAIVPSPAFAITNATPSAPSLVADDSANTLSASSAYGSSEILVSTNNGAYIPYIGSIAVGNVAAPQGYWKFKVKSTIGRNESAVSESPAFTLAVTATTPLPPTITADDNSNYLSATHSLGISEIVVSQNGGAFIPYAGPGYTGDVNLPAGYWKFKIKAAAGRNESAVAESPMFTASTNITPAAPVVQADDITNILSASSPYMAIVVSENNGPYNAYSVPITVGNVARPAGYWKFKVKAATTRNESPVSLSPAFTVVNTTPNAPVVVANDSSNVLSASSYLGSSEIMYSVNGGSYLPYAGQINVGNVVTAKGYYKFKIRSATGRNESLVVESPAFTLSLITAPSPVLTADDNLNVLTASSSLGISEIMVSINNAPYIPYTGQVSVGNITAPAGYWKFKIKGAPGRDESNVVSSPAFTFSNVTPAPPVLYADDSVNALSAASYLGTSEILVSINNGPYSSYISQINVGNINAPAGYWKFKIRSATGRSESAVVESPAFNFAYFTPDGPVLDADDSANVISASSYLGSSEIMVSTNGGAYVPYTGTIIVGNVTVAAGYWKFKIKAGYGRNESTVVLSPAFKGYNITPTPPVVTADDNTNYLSATHSLGLSEIVVSQNDGPFTPYDGAGYTGDVNLPAGYWKFKIKAAPGRNESAVVSSPAFTTAASVAQTVSTPTAPVVVGDDNTNYLGATHTLGISEIVVSENNAPYIPYAGAGYTGNVNLPAGYWKFKIKAAPGRNESPVALSPAFTATSQVAKSVNVEKSTSHDGPALVSDSVSTSKISLTSGMSLKAYPIPAVGSLSVAYTVTKEGNYLLQMFTANGILVKTIFSGTLKPGTSTHHLETGNLTAGNYILRLSSGKAVVNKHIIIMR